MARNPPDILVTTPESLYLILTSQARSMLTGAQAVIVDEIHAVAATKRGSHLALTLERLELQACGTAHGGGEVASGAPGCSGSASAPPRTRSRRSAASSVGPRREVTIVDAGIRKPLDLRIEVPVESMSRPRRPGPATPMAAPELERMGESGTLDLARDLPGAAAPGARAQLHDRVRQQPPRGRAGGVAPERARRQRGGDERERDGGGEPAGAPDGASPGGAGSSGEPRSRSPAPTTARSPVRSARRWRSCSRRAGCRAWWPPARSSSGSTWEPSTSSLQIESPKSVARGPAAHRPRRPRRRRGERGADLPQVPRRPARERGRGPAHARGADRADGRAAQRARRARPADRRDRRRGGELGRGPEPRRRRRGRRRGRGRRAGGCRVG